MSRSLCSRILPIVLVMTLLPSSLAIAPAPSQAAEVWLPAAPLGTARAGHTTTLLPDGQILVTGGWSGIENANLASAERYDPATNRWTPVAPMSGERSGHSATLLRDGRILVTDGPPNGGAEVYDPASDRWTPTGPKSVNPNQTATLLPDGQVLVTGGVGSAERYDPATNSWGSVPPMPTRRIGPYTATPLADGRVLVAGGLVPTGGPRAELAQSAAAEVYDPATNRWTAIAAMQYAHVGHLALPLRDGQILVIGGGGQGGMDLAVERYDPAADRWTSTAPLRHFRSGATATLLPDDQVLIVGGVFARAGESDILDPTAERYDPLADRWTPIAPLDQGRAAHTATLLSNGRLLLVGGELTAQADPPGRKPTATTIFLADDAAIPTACFAETGFCIQGRFLDYWQQNGGLARNGYPISPERREVLEDGREYTVQYFERVRMEYHPTNAAPYDVLLGQFGRRVLAESYHVARGGYAGAIAPAQPLSGQTYFAATGHNLGGRFLAYWQANGGLAQFGYPLTEERWDTIDGQTYRTQYFERARFEYHPENAGTDYEVLLGQFGRRIMAENALLGGAFGRHFLGDTTTQMRLGAPVSAVATSPGATLPFEHGRMFYASAAPPLYLVEGGFLDTNARPRANALAAPPTHVTTQPTIYVLCGDIARGEIYTSTADFGYFWRDTWDESQPAGGGPGPQPGLYEPSRGFGKVWRDQTRSDGIVTTGAHACLGYATSPQEVGYTTAVQYFEGGAMLLSDTAEGRFLYIIAVGRYCNSCPPNGIYERLPLN